MENIAIPVNLSAFVLTPECADSDGPSRISPITQPNYLGLRLDEALMQHDLVEHVDFHLTSPARFNSRLAEIGGFENNAPPKWRRNRMGVYLHWSLPRCYRAANRAQENPDRPRGVRADNDPNRPPNEGAEDLSTPQFPTVPTRWFIARRLNSQDSEDGTKLPQFQTWVVESNRVTRIQNITDDSVDLEVDVSPFMRGKADADDKDWKKVLENQAEIFLGRRNEYSGWPGSGKLWAETEKGTEDEDDFMDLTVLSSSNPVFPDYVPHNGGVFSIIDSFKYKAKDGSTKYLVEANADYFVIGWNSLPNKDLLAPSRPPQLKAALNYLKLALDIPDGTPDDKKTRYQSMLDTKQATRSVLHGAIYSVSFKWGSKPPSRVEMAAEKFGPKFTMEPLSVGVTPLDGVMTFLRAHKDPAAVEKIFGDSEADDIANMVLALGDLLYAADDSFNERAKAQDINLYEVHYAKSTSAGFRWDFAEQAESGKPPKTPTPEQFAMLMALNEKQARLDSLERKLEQRRWDLFSEWWKYVSDKNNIRNTVQAQYRDRVDDLRRQILDLEGRCADLRPDLKSAIENTSFKRVTQNSFYTKKEPTVCIAGMDSGWPKDFMETLPVRVESQITPSADASVIFGGAAIPFPAEVRGIAVKILGECVSISDSSFGSQNQPGKGFQSWGKENPFQPMFVEWEGLYYHIDRSKWTVGVRPSPVGLPNSQIRYGVSELLSKNTDNQKDFRYIQGRELVLPQPIFSLKAAVEAVIDSKDPNSPFKDDDSIQKLLKGIDKLQFISCPLSGLQDHLLTRMMGAHVKPTVNKPGKTNVPLKPAAQPDVGLTEEVLKLIDTKSTVTPYGNLLEFPSNLYPSSPFKGVMHGQFLITKLNIIDKFGQAVALPAPKAKLREPPVIPDSVHPCFSEFLTPDILDNQINTIYPEDKQPDHGEWPLCRFMQLPPAINQNTRLNSNFLNHSGKGSFPFWNETELDKPESPIFGWVIVNHQDSGLQFFRPDGRFYREVRVGGPTNTVLSTKWLPFDPPVEDKQTGDDQLNGLIKKLTDEKDAGKFLMSFFHMINLAIKTMPYPPSEYSGYANALVGKPLALVNVGYSLELAIPALQAQNTLGRKPFNEQSELSSYKFPVKIGDVDRPFDGVVGYFDTDNTKDGTTNWDKIYTYFPDNSNPSFVKIRPENFMRLSPHYVDPVTLKATSADTTFQSYRQAQTAQYKVATMLIDPYTPVHAYSPILPIKSLALPPWTIQQAFSRMTAFFRLGPSLISVDVPPNYDEKRKLDPESWTIPLPDGATSNDEPPMPAIRLPISGKKGLWRWLQPYDVPGKTKEDQHDTKYNEMDVNQEDTIIRKDAPPYTFVEGYLQLARPLLSKDVVASIPKND